VALLDRDEYWDKVYACWLGKNCGGTLGAPLEEVFGRAEPFAVEWYTELREGGIPNDDLELQLILLKAVEERGFGLTARDLAQYWLDHVGYNFDEYGLAKTNLRLGIPPPLCSSYNNWFRDCMGAPIRSELWACLAPGNPALAAHYAYQDASVDHAGGEGVWGELFNAAIQSAAFVERDPDALLDIGLSYIPPASATARAVRAARAARRDGLDWQGARRRVLAETPSPIAQYAPPNIGFQVIGWLYGRDFGDALCTAVNCGYDTDCTGATLGALLGILGGRAGLPARWTAPLGDAIATNESWGGLRGVSTGPNPVPTTLRELTDRVCALGPRLMAAMDATLRIEDHTGLDALVAGSLSAPVDAADRWWMSNLAVLSYGLDALTIEVDYGDAPVIAPGTPKTVGLRLRNTRPVDVTIDARMTTPKGWIVDPGDGQTLGVPAHGERELRYTLRVDDPARVHNTNQGWLLVRPHGRPADLAVPIVLVGARRWLLRGPLPSGETRDDATTLLDRAVDRPPLLDAEASAFAGASGSPDGWRVASASGNALPPEAGAEWTGTLYARLALWNPTAREVRVGIPATCPRALWLNGRLAHRVRHATVLRPNYGHSGGDGASYVDCCLEPGWNDVLIVYTRDAASPAFAAHVTLATVDLHDGLVDVAWTTLPWEDTQRTLLQPEPSGPRTQPAPQMSR